jgi:hypothetical protein
MPARRPSREEFWSVGLRADLVGLRTLLGCARGIFCHAVPLGGHGVVTIARPVDAEASEMPPTFVRCEKPIAVMRDTAAAAREPEWQ